MTPEESRLVGDLFDRLARLETAPRDGAAERLIADGIGRAPHALYALVQTALVQDEALKRANARIEELQAQLEAQADGAAATTAPEQPPSFLDSMREAFGGRPAAAAAPRGSVPSVRAGGNQLPPTYAPPANYASPPSYAPPPYGSPAFGSGNSFLGSAASTAAGVIGGALLLDGIRSMFGHHGGGLAPSAFADLGSNRTSPWSTSSSAADSDLARDAGINDIGQAAAHDRDASPDTAADTSTDNDSIDSDDDAFADTDDTDTADDGDFGYDDSSSGSDSYDV